MSRPLVILATLAVLGACNSDRTYECTIGQSAECNRDGQQGDCLAPGFCAFTDSSCDTGLRWDSTARDDLAGQCVSPNGDGDGDGPNLCGGTAELTGVPGQRCGVCDSGAFACDGMNAVVCQDELTLDRNITADGNESASSVFSGFPPNLAVDGDLGTSWFSAGSDTDGAESVFSWINSEDQCITQVNFTGNEFHANSNFRENFGFGQMTVEIRDQSDAVVFSKIEQLPGTPDEAKSIDTGGVIGRSVHLKLQGHESSDCGGFAELVINAKL